MFALVYIILVPTFIIFLYISLKFIWGKESKDERGEHIINMSYTVSSPIFPIGWLLIELYHDHLYELTFNTYRDCISLLVLLTFIVQGIVITRLKRKI